MELVTGDGSVLTCSRAENPEVFAAARVGLGALGVVSTITLRCVPAFTLRAVNEPMRLDDVLEVLDEHVEGNDHFEFNWFPHTEWVQAKQNNRVTSPPVPRARAKEWFDEVFLENVALKAAWRVGRRVPSTIPTISRQLTKAITHVESTEKSYKVFTTPRLVRFYEMEYGVPRAAVSDCLRELRSFIDSSGLLIQVPVEVRFVAADDIPLSMASGRDSAFVACHVFEGRGYEQYFRGVERIMAGAGGRPHWGKLHFQTAETLAPRYPEWSRFQRRARPDRPPASLHERLPRPRPRLTGSEALVGRRDRPGEALVGVVDGEPQPPSGLGLVGVPEPPAQRRGDLADLVRRQRPVVLRACERDDGPPRVEPSRGHAPAPAVRATTRRRPCHVGHRGRAVDLDRARATHTERGDGRRRITAHCDSVGATVGLDGPP